LYTNISDLNQCAKDIIELFIEEKINDLEKNPVSEDSKAQFAKLFNKFNKILETAKVQ
jgi:type I restriction enzyme R subunit